MKTDVKLLSSLSKTLLGLSLMTFTTLYAEAKVSIESSIENYAKLYEPTLYRAIQENGIEIDESASPEQESGNAVMPSLLKKVIKPPYLYPYPKEARYQCKKNGGILLENKYAATCVSKDGTFGNGYQLLGMTFNPTGTGTVTAPDYLSPGSPWEFFSVSFNGAFYHNNNSHSGGAIGGGDNIPTRISPLNRWTPGGIPYHEGGVMAYSTIPRTGLRITQKYTIDPTAREIIVRVEVYNAGGNPIERLYYARGIDPDQDIPLTFATLNMRGGTFGGLAPIAKKNIVQANGIHSKLSVALYSVDPIVHNTCISPSWTMNPVAISSMLPNPSCPVNSNYGDSTINIGFNLGTLMPKQKKVFSFKYLFEKRAKGRIGILHPLQLPLSKVK